MRIFGSVRESGKKTILIFFAVVLAALLAACSSGETAEQSAYERGIASLEENDYMSAMAAFQDAVRIDGEKARGYRGQGIVYLREGNYYNAITMFSRCLDSLTNSEEDRAMREDVLLYQEQAYSLNGQLDLAREICDDLREVEGREATALILRGELSVAEGDVASAEEDFRQALAIDSSYGNYLRIYESYVTLRRRGDGAALLYEALEQVPRGSADEYEVGRIYYVLGEADEAKEHLDRAWDAGEDEAGLLLARISLDTGDVSGARSIYRTYLEQEMKAGEAYNGLALCDIADRNLESALGNIERGLASGDGAAQEMLLFNEIVIYERMLDFETAKTKMTAFLQRYPANPEAIRENLFLQNR